MKIKVAIVDSGPIIKGSLLEAVCSHAISVPGVIKEIKDANTRKRLCNLPPFFFSIRSPSEAAVKHVVATSKKTGDFKVLSKVDIEVLALAYELQYLKSTEEVENLFEKLSVVDDIDNLLKEDMSSLNDKHFSGTDEDELFDSSFDITDSEEEDVVKEVEDAKNEEDICKLEIEIADENVNDILVSEDAEESGNWITNDNFEEMRKNNFGMEKNSEDIVSVDSLTVIPTVGCLTTDYAMQNVLLHMKVAILSVDGLIVKQPRIFISLCRSCFKKYKRTDFFFCPHCGNSNIGRIPARIKENGEIDMFLRRNYQPNLRNTKFTVPIQKGGKHTDGTFYVYCADQQIPMERPKKSKAIIDEFDNSGVRSVSDPRDNVLNPFSTHQVTARSSVLGISAKSMLRPSVPRGNRKKHRR